MRLHSAVSGHGVTCLRYHASLGDE
jgi:hypothetical protein